MAFFDKQRNICIAKINKKLFIKLTSFLRTYLKKTIIKPFPFYEVSD